MGRFVSSFDRHTTRGVPLPVVVAVSLAVLAVTVPALAQSARAVDNTARSQPLTHTKLAQDAAPPRMAGTGIAAQFAALPAAFEPNVGQTDAHVKFLSRGLNYTLFVTPAETVLAMREKSASGVRAGQEHNTAQAALLKALSPGAGSLSRSEVETREAVLRISLAGANTTPKIEGVKKLRAESNYFIGNNPKKWLRGVPNYAGVEVSGVYPGINLIYYSGAQGQLEYDFRLSAGANPDVIRLRFAGGKKLTVDKQGDLLIALGGATLTERAPVIYQEKNGRRQTINGGWILINAHEAGFKVANYDRSRPLVIGPQLICSGYLGGTIGAKDVGEGVAVDSSGEAFLTGESYTSEFPAATGTNQDGALKDNDKAAVFVTKIDPSKFGSASLIYSTYVGGSSFNEGTGIAVDSASGDAYITGDTSSSDYPVTANAYQDSFEAGNVDPFVTVLNATGSEILYSTYMGTEGSGLGIAVDNSGAAYITGNTTSNAFPTTQGAFQTTLVTLAINTFVAKIDPSKSGSSSLVYSTYLGGNSNGSGLRIAVNSAGEAYVTGFTASKDFPVTVSAYQETLLGSEDAFVTELNASGTALLYSTYLGGASTSYKGRSDSATQFGTGIAVNAAGDIFVTGGTNSDGFPVTQNAYEGKDTVVGELTGDAFVAQLNPAKWGRASLVYSTLLGGSGSDAGEGVGVDSSGNIYVTGQTTSTDFPATVDALPGKNNSTANSSFETSFLATLNPSRPRISQLVFSTYLGGNSEDDAFDLAATPTGTAYVVGTTASASFLASSDALAARNSARNSAGRTAFLSVVKVPGTVLPGMNAGSAISANQAGGKVIPAAGSRTSRVAD